MNKEIKTKDLPKQGHADKILDSVFNERDPNKDEIFVALSGTEFEVEKYNFGQGITIQKTYAFIFAPYMAAFKKPDKPGDPSPGPWKVVSGGHSSRVNYELHIPLEFELEDWFDRLNTGWWLLSLMRMKGSSLLTAPVISNYSFSQIGELDLEANFSTIEFNDRKIPIDTDIGKLLTVEDLDWVNQHWRTAGVLMRNFDNFNDAFQALDKSLHEERPSLSMVTIWGALERLFADFRAELNYRVSLNIATFLEPAGKSRIELFKKVKRLYGARSKAAHGRPNEDYEEFKESYNLLRSAIIKMIEENHVPSQDDLEKLIMNE
jgi:hypothetical protein